MSSSKRAMASKWRKNLLKVKLLRLPSEKNEMKYISEYNDMNYNYFEKQGQVCILDTVLLSI